MKASPFLYCDAWNKTRRIFVWYLSVPAAKIAFLAFSSISLFHWIDIARLKKKKKKLVTSYPFGRPVAIKHIWRPHSWKLPEKRTLKEWSFILIQSMNNPLLFLSLVFQNTIEGHLAYFPMVGRLKCDSTYVDHLGHWDLAGYGILSVYKSDWKRFGGKHNKKLLPNQFFLSQSTKLFKPSCFAI